MRNLLILTFFFCIGLFMQAPAALGSVHHQHGDEAVSPFDSPGKAKTDSRPIHCILKGHFNHICPHSLDSPHNKNAQITKPCAGDPAIPIASGAAMGKAMSQEIQVIQGSPATGRIWLSFSIQPTLYFDKNDPPPQIQLNHSKYQASSCRSTAPGPHETDYHRCVCVRIGKKPTQYPLDEGGPYHIHPTRKSSWHTRNQFPCF